MKVFITGITGFLAAHVAEEFKTHGWLVHGSTSRPQKATAEIVVHRNGQVLNEAVFRDSDVVVHCAHDFTPGGGERNITGIEQVAQAAWRAGVRRQVYVSSLSARADATSEYGTSKYQTEQRLRSIAGLSIVRPGTIVGAGGVFGRLFSAVRRLPVVPLIDGGRREMQLITAHDTARSLLLVGTQFPPGHEYNLYYAMQPTLREVVLAIERRLNVRRLHLVVPGRLLLLGCTGLERCGIRPPIGADNIRGFLVGSHHVPPVSREIMSHFDGGTLDEMLAHVTG